MLTLLALVNLWIQTWREDDVRLLQLQGNPGFPDLFSHNNILHSTDLWTFHNYCNCVVFLLIINKALDCQSNQPTHCARFCFSLTVPPVSGISNNKLSLRISNHVCSNLQHLGFRSLALSLCLFAFHSTPCTLSCLQTACSSFQPSPFIPAWGFPVATRFQLFFYLQKLTRNSPNCIAMKEMVLLCFTHQNHRPDIGGVSMHVQCKAKSQTWKSVSLLVTLMLLPQWSQKRSSAG